MRKSILYMALAATALTMSVTGCKSASAPVETTPAATEAPETEDIVETEAVETTADTADVEEYETIADDESIAETETDNTDDAQADSTTSGESPAQTLLASFKEQVAADASLNAQGLAEALLANSVIPFAGASMPVEPGLLMGFGEAEITDFEEGVMFAPMIGSIPFMGYVFDLADGADMDAFVATLKDNADPRWNICTEAEETVVEAVGDKVFFVMSPAQFEE